MSTENTAAPGRYTDGYSAGMAAGAAHVNDVLRERDDARAECLSRGIEIARLSCEVDRLAALAAQQPAMEVLQQALTDPENQPSQFGTVPLAQHEREIARLHEEAAESDATRLRMADLLNRTANAIRGEPADGVRWSWGDLPDRAQAAMNMLSGAMALAAQQPAADELQRLQDRLRVAETALAVYQRAEAQGELQPAASGEPAALNSHERYWVQIRHKVVAALAAEGLRILSDKNRVWLERVGKVTAHGGPAGTTGGASHG